MSKLPLFTPFLYGDASVILFIVGVVISVIPIVTVVLVLKGHSCKREYKPIQEKIILILILHIWFILCMCFTLVYPLLIELTELALEIGIILGLIALRRYLVISVSFSLVNRENDYNKAIP